MLRRQAHAFPRRQKTPVVWHTNGNGSTWVGNTPTALASNVLTTLALVDATVNTAVDRVTVFRIRGTMVLIPGAAQPLTYAMGIIVKRGLDAPDPTLQLNSMESWLWLRLGVLQAAPLAVAGVDNQTQMPDGAQIDVKVKRILRPGDELALQIRVLGSSANMYPNLRVLIGKTVSA